MSALEVAVDLAVRQLALLALLAALGAGPAAFLPRTVPAVTRISLAPAFGLALGAAASVSAAYLMPMSTGAWAVLVPLAAASLAAALLRLRAAGLPRPAPAAREVAAVAAVALAVTAALDAPLVADRSLGPMGWQINDSTYLIAQRVGLERHTSRDLRIDYTLRRFLNYPRPSPVLKLSREDRRDVPALYEGQWKYVPIGFASLGAGANVLFGWRGVDTQSAFLAALVVVASIGGFGLALWITSSVWAGLLAGLLFAGPLGYQLYVESAEASRAAIAMLPATALVGILLLRGVEPALVVLFGLLLAGLVAVYPLWIPAFALTVGVVAAAAAILRAGGGRLDRSAILRGLGALAATALVAAMLSPVALVRGINFAHLVGATDFVRDLVLLGLPSYHLPAEVLPGWLLQTREFYSLAPLDLGDLRGLLRGFVLPLLLLAVAAYGGWRFRHRGALALAAPLPVVALLALRADQAQGCSYCVQRQLAMLEPSVAILLAAGLAALPLAAESWPLRHLSLPPRALGGVAVLAGVLILALAAQKSVVLAQRAHDGGEILDSRIRALTDDLDRDSGPVLLELTAAGGVTLPATYWAVDENTGTRPGLAPRSAGFQSVTSFAEAGADLRVGDRPDYRLVLTRMRGIATARRTIETDGPYALERRAYPFDPSPLSGVLADVAHDPGGTAWVVGPLRFGVAADSSRPAWLRLVLRGPGVSSLAVGGVARLSRRGDRAELCVPVPGRSSLREAEVPLTFSQLPPTPAPERYALGPIPGKALRLAAMRADGRPCAGRAPMLTEGPVGSGRPIG
jgi:hypothetical protein